MIIFFMFSCVGSSFAANILAINPMPSYSHQVAFAPLWRELSLRGHQVTVITTDPVYDPKLINLTEIDVKFSYKYGANIGRVAGTGSMWETMPSLIDLVIHVAAEQLQYPPIRELMGKKFDVVLVENFFSEFSAFAHIYQCPKILFGSLDVASHLHHFLGNPSHPFLYPEFGFPASGVYNFKYRVLSILYSWYLSYYYFYNMYPRKEILLHRYYNTTISMVSVLSDIDLMLINLNPAVQRVRAIGPTTVYIGGRRPLYPPTIVSKDLKDFMDGAKDGFIYFSLGSNVKSKELGRPTLDSIIAALSEVPYKVLWKFEADVLPGKPHNVKLVKWAPQQQILAHPNIKLFITQGGLQSMEEGIYSEVPFVVIPFFGDQQQNANLMRTKGIARVVDRKPVIKKEELKTAILEVIHNPSYKAAVQNLKRLALDTPMTGLEKAVWWTEYVIRNNGTKHLRNPAADLPSYQYYLLDVLGFLILVVALAVWVIVVVLKFSFKCLSQYNCRITDKSSKIKEQ